MSGFQFIVNTQLVRDQNDLFNGRPAGTAVRALQNGKQIIDKDFSYCSFNIEILFLHSNT